jgi:methionine synthase II (cobalamin-independent)
MPEFNFLTTHVGSVPHTQAHDLNARLLSTLDIPCWLQLVRRDFRENIYTQYAPTLPGAVVLADQEKVIIDTSASDFDNALEKFYQAVIDENVEAFALHPNYAQGFHLLLEALEQKPGKYAKGQVMGPISFGLTVADQDGRACLYNDVYVDVLVKHMAFNARWQVQELQKVSELVILFVDEPYMASFGSAYVSLGREQVIAWLDEIYEALHAAGALTGTHCCGNTDWGVLLNTQVDILNLDAYDFIENLALYPVELREFLDHGGAVCWGLVPNNEHIFNETSQTLAKRLRDGITLICEKAANRGVTIRPDEFASRSLLAPACGLGPASVEIAERAFEVLAETGEILVKG